MVTPPINPSQFSYPLPHKLTDSNFLLWRSQIVPIIKGHGLFGFFDGSKSPPEAMITSTTTNGITTSPNPEFETWERQDQLLMAWIFSSLTPSVLAQVLRCETTASLWQTLHNIYASKSQARILELKTRLQTIKKGGSSCSDYLTQVQSIADELRMIGQDIPDSDLVMCVFSGLGPDYNSLVTSLTSSFSSLSLADLRGHLLTFEARLEKQIQTTDNLTFTVSQAKTEKTTPHVSVPQNEAELFQAFITHQFSNFKRNWQSPNARGRGGRFNRGRGGRALRNINTGRSNASQVASSTASVQSDTPSQCQICLKFGHTADICYHRFKNNYQSQVYTASSPQVLLTEPVQPSAADDWFLDSGASSHISFDLNSLQAALPYDGNEVVKVGNGESLSIAHIGHCTLHTSHQPILLNNVLHVPAITKNLISISKLLQDNDLIIEFTNSQCLVKDPKTSHLLLQAELVKGLYKISSCQLALITGTSSINGDLWHQRLGHPSSSVMQVLTKENFIPSSKFALCDACERAKSHRLPYTDSTRITSSMLQLVHIDVWGPASVLSSNGNKYFVLFVDDYSRFCWLYPIANKSDVLSIFQKFKALTENLFSTTIKSIQCDGGSEFKPVMSQFPQIQYRISCPYTPSQNGIVERKNRHVVELGLSIMKTASIPLKFWDHIFHSVVFLINRLPTKATNNAIPYTQAFNASPDYSLLKVLGCLCYPYLRDYSQHKLDSRSAPCVFIGYSSLHKGYKCLDPSTNKVYISRHVVFHETIFPFAHQLTSSSISPTVSQNTPEDISLPLAIIPTTQPPVPIIPESSSTPPPTSPPHSTHPMTTRTRDNTRKAKRFPDHIALASSSDPVEPTCFSQAHKDPTWRLAMTQELTALAQNNTWQLVPPNPSQNLIGCKWIFRVKKRSDGTVERFKARLVAKGYNQEYGLDYLETFSPVVKPTTIRIILTIALTHHWPIRQLDVNNAFLHGDLQEDVFMLQPPGFIDKDKPQFVCKLNKSLYGLKQSPREWFKKLHDFLLSIGFQCSKSDNSLFFNCTQNYKLFLLVYVDDIILTGSDSTLLSSIISQLDQAFTIKDLGTLSYFLGVKATTTSAGFHLSQSSYISDLLIKAKMQDAKPCQTPMATNTQLTKFGGTPFSDPHLYRSIVGGLQYATLTHPEIAFSVNQVSQFMHSPSEAHWSAVKRILRYLKGSLSFGLLLQPSQSLTISGFADADWGGSIDDRRSTSGYCVFLGNNVISWSSKKQSIVAKSSTEAEYRALSSVAADVVWLQSILTELSFTVPKPILWCDNLGATFLASNAAFHARTKHIELDVHFIRDLIAAKRLEVRFLSSEDQTADIFTKGLSAKRFQLLRNKLRVLPCSA